MIGFEGVTAGGLRDVSLRIDDGALCQIVAGSEQDREALIHCLSGELIPERGRVMAQGRDSGAMTEAERLLLMREVGIVWRAGGLISNLSIGENIILPLMYHYGKVAPEVEGRVCAILGGLGYDEQGVIDMMRKRVSDLPLPERRIAGLVRAALMEPAVMILDSMFEGIEDSRALKLFDFIRSFHSGRPGRITVCLSSIELPMDWGFESLTYVREGSVVAQ